jgi:hypothetical protein
MMPGRRGNSLGSGFMTSVSIAQWKLESSSGFQIIRMWRFRVKPSKAKDAWRIYRSAGQRF